ncbi:MAG: ABC transporter substrate-binding protein [Rhodocyclaceae bacterium]|nr:ABC transporter substrate-binding protein [Rhodocyclaceae bacterium]MCP5232805.1 ABC transporter substrate-binding protein [Zoogloeaceae bacterium]MCB1910336.1 ABC transporter substrate-binding protein [Rhodocyclaceae bacterium]MCP5240773.1 ABC transporter substrate-binding protein [Zoogloeaceae bacterium]MCP5253116.1 ABC transporter substrate-binding protein [Zoogloeaceae bacterium]
MIKKTLLLAGLILACQVATAKDWKQIRFATEGAYPPFNVTAPDGSVQGFDVDIANALCEEMKTECTWVKQEWDGMIPALMSRKFDAISASMSITEERKKKVDFTDKYYATPLALVAKKGSTLKPELASLKGKRIGVQRGTVADNFATRFWADHGVELVRYARQEEAYLDLSAGRIDASWVDSLEADGGFLTKPAGQDYDFAGSKVYGRNAEEKAVIGEGVGIAIRKRDTDLRDQLNKALAAIRANGTYERISKKYFPHDIYGE